MNAYILNILYMKFIVQKMETQEITFLSVKVDDPDSACLAFFGRRNMSHPRK
jgi:hypothetical protein